MRLLIAIGLGLVAAASAWAEDVTLTTYYPSPRGVYDELKTSGNVVIGDVTVAPAARLQVEGGGILAQGTIGNTPVSGGGTRLMWIPGKAALRAGRVSGNQWDDINIGDSSVAMGQNNTVDGNWSLAMGFGNSITSDGASAFAIGQNNVVSTAMGGALGDSNNVGAGAGYQWGFAIGSNNTVGFESGVAIGRYLSAGITQQNAMVIGSGVNPLTPLTNDVRESLMVGFNSNIPTLMVTRSIGAGTTGTVGIGTAAPLAKLDIVQTGGQDALLVEDQAADPSPFRITNTGDEYIGGHLHLENLTDVAAGDLYVSGGTDGIFYIVNTNTAPTVFPQLQRIAMVIHHTAAQGGDVAVATFDSNPPATPYTVLEGDLMVNDPTSPGGNTTVLKVDSTREKVGVGMNPGGWAKLEVGGAVEVKVASSQPWPGTGGPAYYLMDLDAPGGWQWEAKPTGALNWQWNQGGVATIPMTLTQGGDLTMTGTLTAAVKNFAIPHPLDPTNKQLVHASIEGPEIAVYYRGEAVLEHGMASITLPAYFEALTRSDGRTVLVTPQFTADEPISQLAASRVKDGAFSVRAVDDRNPSQAFYWEVKAVRADVAPLQVERSATPEEASNAP